MDQDAKERYGRALDLFDRLCDLPAVERAKRLDEVCRSEPELRREIESLLAHDSDSLESDHGLSHEKLVEALVEVLRHESDRQ